MATGIFVFAPPASPQDYIPYHEEPFPNSPTPEERERTNCIITDACGPIGPPGPGIVSNPDRWAALALSNTTLRAGASHGQGSKAEAEQLALENCRRNGSVDCKLVDWAKNQCLAFAISDPERDYGYDAGSDRGQAATKALTRCQSTGGKHCYVLTTPCANDDARWPPPLPLPTGSAAAQIDRNTTGTWVLAVNPGRWVWRISGNGTYEFHSEAPDGVPSHAGTFSASAGHWTLHATNGYSDSGTYEFQPPGTLIATGRLGTGHWQRSNGAASD